MTEEVKELKEKLQKREIEVNGQELFFRSLLKALMYDLNSNLKIRGEYIPHMIINTGDDQMYLAVKGQDMSIEPFEVSNENFTYNKVPRCMVQPGGVNLLLDQLTNPYTRGYFSIEYNDNLYTFTAEFRRMPVKMSVNLKYILSTFTDALDVIQQCITHLSIIRNFTFSYMGQKIMCSYQMSESYDTEYQAEFDGLSSGDKNKTIEFEIEVETNIPIYSEKTVMAADEYVNMKPVVHTSGYYDDEDPEKDKKYSSINPVPINTIKNK